MTNSPILPIEILAEIAKCNMFVFGALTRACKRLYKEFAALSRRDKMLMFMRWCTKQHVFYMEAYWEYTHNGVVVPHVVKLRYDDQGNILQDAEMWLGRKWGKCLTYYRYDAYAPIDAAARIHTRAWYVDGKLHGKLLEYHDNGVLWCDANYRHGLINGGFRAYHDNGQLHQIKHYDMGKCIGEWFEYDRWGNLSAQGVNCDRAHQTSPRKCIVL